MLVFFPPIVMSPRHIDPVGGDMAISIRSTLQANAGLSSLTTHPPCEQGLAVVLVVSPPSPLVVIVSPPLVPRQVAPMVHPTSSSS
jgi:hypothetical protein